MAVRNFDIKNNPTMDHTNARCSCKMVRWPKVHNTSSSILIFPVEMENFPRVPENQ